MPTRLIKVAGLRGKLEYHRSGDVLWIDMFSLKPEDRGQGGGRIAWKEFESSIPKDITVICLFAGDTGGGPSAGFWEKMGFTYQYDQESGTEWDQYMWKGVNGHPTPEPLDTPDEEHGYDIHTGAKKVKIVKTPGFVIEVPQERRQKFFVRPKTPLEYWAFKNRPRVFINEPLIFTFGGKPVAKAVVVRVEAPGKGEGEYKHWHKVYWKPATFRKFKVTASDHPKVLYHLSRRTNRQSILKNGLLPLLKEYKDIERAPGVYFFQSLEGAKDYGFFHAQFINQATDIWECRIPENYKLYRDPHPEMDEFDAWMSHDILPPENLKVVDTILVPKSTSDAPPRYKKGAELLTATSKKFYHGTKKKNLDDILKNGLKVEMSEAHTEWNKAIYLACDVYTAKNYEGMHGGGEPWVIFEIDGRKLNENYMRPDDYDFPDIWDQEGREENWAHQTWQTSLKMSCQIAYLADIPPNAIKVYEGKTRFAELEPKETMKTVEDPDYYMTEGCGIYAVDLARKNGGEIYVMSAERGEEWSEEIPYEVTHAFVKKDGKTYDIRGERTPDKMAWELSMGAYSIKGPWTPDAFEAKFMGGGDDKPLFGKDAALGDQHHHADDMPTPLRTVPKRPAVIDWYSDSPDVAGAEPELIDIDPKTLLTDQATVSKSHLDKILAHIDKINEPTASTSEEHSAHPLVLGTSEGDFIFDGNHRCAAALLKDLTIKVLYLDLTLIEDWVPEHYLSEEDESEKTAASKLPKGWRVTVKGEKVPGSPYPYYWGHIWKDNQFYGTCGVGSEYRDKAREAAIDWAWQASGQPRPKTAAEDTQTFYHGTTWEAAKDINKTGIKANKWKFGPGKFVWVTIHPGQAYEYGQSISWHELDQPERSAVVEFEWPYKESEPDPEHEPHGDMYRRIPSDIPRSAVRKIQWFEKGKIVKTADLKTADHVDDEGYWAGEGNAASGVLPVCPSKGTVCFAMRSSEVMTPNCWGTIGGAVQKDMSPQQSAKKEMAEETGYHGGINLIPAYVFTDRGFSYHNFIGVVSNEFSFSPSEGFGWETDHIVWVPYQDALEDMQANPGDYHPGVLKLFANSKDTIERALKVPKTGAAKYAWHEIAIEEGKESNIGSLLGGILENDKDLAAWAEQEIVSPAFTEMPKRRKFMQQFKGMKIGVIDDMHIYQRGKGHGTKMLEDFIQRCKSAGCSAVLLQAGIYERQEKGFDLVEWYKRHGFATLETSGGLPLMVKWLKPQGKQSADEEIIKSVVPEIEKSKFIDESEWQRMNKWLCSLQWRGRNPWYPEKFPWFAIRLFSDVWVASNELSKEQLAEGKDLASLKKYLSEFAKEYGTSLDALRSPKTIDMQTNALTKRGKTAEVSATAPPPDSSRLPCPSGKRKYYDERSAIGPHQQWDKGTPNLRAYQCPKCGWYHLTSKPQRQPVIAAGERRYYHVSSVFNRSSIEEQGLLPQTKEFTHIPRPAGVYVFSSFEDAANWAYDYWHEFAAGMDELDIWEVKIDPKKLKPDYHGQVKNGFYSTEPVLPQDIKLVDTLLEGSGIHMAATHTQDYALRLIEALKQTVHEADFRVIGSVGAGRESDNDLDIMVDIHPDAVFEDDKDWLETSGLFGAMKLMGFDYEGPSEFSPADSTEKSEVSGKYLDPAGSSVEKFFNPTTMHTVEFWFTESGMPKEADWKSKYVLPTALALTGLGVGAPPVQPGKATPQQIEQREEQEAPAEQAKQPLAPADVTAALRTASKATGIPLAVLSAIAHNETSYGTDTSQGGSGSNGFMQMTPDALTEVNKVYGTDYIIEDMDDPDTAALAAAQYLHILLRKFDKNLDATIAAYNSGPAHINKVLADYGEVTPETLAAAGHQLTSTYLQKAKARMAPKTGAKEAGNEFPTQTTPQPSTTEHPDVMYHYAGTENRTSIQKHGLLGSKSSAIENAVFLDSKLTEEGKYTDTWEVNVKGLELEPDWTTDISDRDEWEGHTWWIFYGDIPANRLKLVHAGKMAMDASWIKKAAGFAFKSFKKLWHVGSMNAKNKQEGSLEGAGLSVSVNPEEWMEIAQIGGDLWELTKSGNKFLNFHRLSKQQRGQIMVWGVKKGYVTEVAAWRLTYYDSETDEERYMEFPTKEEAEAELGQYGDDEKIVPIKGKTVSGTDKLKDRTKNQHANETVVAFDLLVTVYAEDELDCDGVWWQDTLDPLALSAPRGVIFPSKLKSWKARKTQMASAWKLVPATAEWLNRAKLFLKDKWTERHKELGREGVPIDLAGACKFASLFANKLFGGKMVGNKDHQVVKAQGELIDLTELLNINTFHHDKEFWMNPEHEESMKSIEPRVQAWVDEFYQKFWQDYFKTHTSAKESYLYHGTNDIALAGILKDGGMPAGSHWGISSVADYFAKGAAEEEGNPVILRIPMNRFNEANLEIDHIAIAEPLTMALGVDEDTLYEEWQQVPGDGTWQDCLQIYGAVKYMAPIKIVKADVWT